MPCDNFSNTVNQEYVDVVNTIEFVINSEDCNGIIVCGDFNTSFSRSNAQSACLTDFINRNRLISSWDNPHANIDFLTVTTLLIIFQLLTTSLYLLIFMIQ